MLSEALFQIQESASLYDQSLRQATHPTDSTEHFRKEQQILKTERLDVVAHACDSSSWEAEAGR